LYDRTRKELPFNTRDCLIEETAWAGLTVIVVLLFFPIGFKHKSNFCSLNIYHWYVHLLFSKDTVLDSIMNIQLLAMVVLRIPYAYQMIHNYQMLHSQNFNYAFYIILACNWCLFSYNKWNIIFNSIKIN
jgi:hypothetical protein